MASPKQFPKKIKAGAVLKKFRKELGRTLSELSEQTGIPVSSLSKIENGKSEVTIDRLLDISLALGVNIADFLGTPPPEKDSPLLGRRSITLTDQQQKVDSSYGSYTYHAQDLRDKNVIPIVANVEATTIEEFGDYHRHQGEEFVYVLEGELALHTDLYVPVHLKKGESIYFDSMIGHAYIAAGDTPCKILIISGNPGDEVVDMWSH